MIKIIFSPALILFFLINSFVNNAYAIPMAKVEYSGISINIDTHIYDDTTPTSSLNPLAMSVVDFSEITHSFLSGPANTDASSNFTTWDGGFLLYASSTASVSGSGFALSSISLSMTVLFTNITTFDVLVQTNSDWSSFNPGGPEIGARVENSSLEYARFESFVDATLRYLDESNWTTWQFAYDSHSCDTRDAINANYSEINYPAIACGVSAPDESGDYRYFMLDAGNSFSMEVNVAILTEASRINEPPSAIFIFLSFLTVFCLSKAHRNRGRLINTQ